MDSNRSNDLLTPTAARNLGPHPETTLCIASHGVRRWGLQCADASRSRPAAAEIFINRRSKLYYDQPSMPIASHFSSIVPAFTPPRSSDVRTCTLPRAPRVNPALHVGLCAVLAFASAITARPLIMI